MNFDELLSALTLERYDVLKRAVELGKWPDGKKLLPDEKESALQVLIAYDIKNKSAEDRIGFMPKMTETACETDHDENSHGNNLIAKN